MATIYICDVCNKEDKNKMEFKLKIWKSDGEVTYEMDLCGSCFNKLEKLISKKEEVSGIDLIKDIFHPVYQKIVEKGEDLIGKQKKRTHGFEPSWFTPQVVSALKAKGLNPISHGKGVDLTFPDGLKLELKAASDFRLNYLIKEGALRYNAPVLFLCNGTDKNKINKLKERPEVRVLHYDYLNDGKDDWILGLIEPIKGLETSDNNKLTQNRPVENIPIKKSNSKKYRPQLRPKGSYKDFENLKDHLENAPDSKITMCMDKALLSGRTMDQLVKEMTIHNNRLGSNDFNDINRINHHIKYRVDHDGWIFEYSGSPKEPNTHVRLVGLGPVKSK